MVSTNNEHTQNDRAGGHDEEVRNTQPRRLNPRLVFADPDVFFSDLLMEQQEEG